MERKIVNPVFGDTVVVLKDSHDTNGAYSLFDASIPAGNPGPPPHYHKDFTEYFEVLEGKLHMLYKDKKIALKPGEKILVEKNVLHTFWITDEGARFLCKSEPACDGQITSMKIAANLALAGLTTKKGIPKNLFHLSFLVEMSGSNLPGIFRYVERIMVWLANTKKGKLAKQALLSKHDHWYSESV